MNLPDNARTATKIGLLTTISLVAGNMIGSGIFLLPASLAMYGGISMLGWVFSGIGAIFLALVFGRLSRILPKAGGPYAYTREGYGDFAGFLVAWGYWVSVWTANGAIAITFTSYLSVFFPILAQSQEAVVITSLTVIWFLTWVNSRGTITSGKVQFIFTILKLIPLILIGFVGIFFINFNHFTPFNLSTESDFSAITATATLTLWALLGMESATIPADDVKDPSSTIPKATILGTLLVIIVYLFSSFAVFGLISPGELQNSTAPFADAAFKIWGNWGKYMVSLGAIAATFGALNGWILLQGQVPTCRAIRASCAGPDRARRGDARWCHGETRCRWGICPAHRTQRQPLQRLPRQPGGRWRQPTRGRRAPDRRSWRRRRCREFCRLR